MQKCKSQRHVRAARARWRAAETRAAAERAAGIEDRPPLTDRRQPIALDLTSYGGPRLRIEPRLGYVAVRLIDEATGAVECMAIKTALHHLADRLPRTMGPRCLT